MTTHSEELERTIGSDPVLSLDEHAGEVYLARTLAAELDRQTATGTIQTRTIASYAGVIGALRRIIRDDRARRVTVTAPARASRLGLIKAQAATAAEATG